MAGRALITPATLPSAVGVTAGASSLALAPHVHLLVAEGVWNDGVFMEVEAVLERARTRTGPVRRRPQRRGRVTSAPART